jgi:hypothetical protein
MDINVDSLMINPFFYGNSEQDDYDEDDYDEDYDDDYDDKVLVENTILIENEIEISKILEDLESNVDYNFIIDTKRTIMNVNEKNNKNNLKKYVILTYMRSDKDYSNFIVNLLNSFNEERKPVIIKLVNIYSVFLEELNYLSLNGIYFMDFSYKNINIEDDRNKFILTNFQSCIRINPIKNDKNPTNKLIILKIVENTEYFGNKHILLFIIKYLIKYDDYNSFFIKKEELIDVYCNNLHFLVPFSQKVKDNYKKECQTFINELLIRFKMFHQDHKHDYTNDKNNSFCDQFITFLLQNQTNDYLCEIEYFMLNSLFLNVIIQIIRVFNIKNSNYTKFMNYLLKSLYYKVSKDHNTLIHFSDFYDIFILSNLENNKNNDLIDLSSSASLDLLYDEMSENIDKY